MADALVRPATTADAPALARLQLDIWQQAYAGLLPTAVLFTDPDQQAQVKKIMDDNRANLHGQFEQMHTARQQMADKLLSSGTVTAADLSTQTQQIGQAQQQLLQNELAVALQVRAILTPAQLQKVAQFHQQFESLHQQMRALLGPGGAPGDGPPPPDAPDAPPPV